MLTGRTSKLFYSNDTDSCTLSWRSRGVPSAMSTAYSCIDATSGKILSYPSTD